MSSVYMLPLWTLILTFSWLARAEDHPLSVSGSLSPYHVEAQQNVEVHLKLQLREGYKAFLDQFKLESANSTELKISSFKIEPAFEFYDKFSKKNRMGTKGDASLKAIIEMPADIKSKVLPLKLTYQACTDTYCLFPKVIEIQLPFEIAHQKNVQESPNIENWLQINFDNPLSFFNLLAIFVFGILTSLTPCIFPLIPITLGIFSRATSHPLLASLVYVTGMATTYAALGVIAAMTGALFGSLMSSPWLLVPLCILTFLMGLSLLGLFEFEAPRFLRDSRWARYQGVGLFGVFITGLISGLIASPCVSPILVSILTYIAKSQNVLVGFALMFVYAFGIGQLFILLSVSKKVQSWLPHSGPWMVHVKRLLGVLILGVFYYYLSLLVSDRGFDFAIGLGLVFISSVFSYKTEGVKPGLGFHLIRSLMKAAFIIGLFFMVVSVFNLRPLIAQYTSVSITEKTSKIEWIQFSDEALAEAKAQGQPVIIDFFADWCLACKQLDSETFSSPLIESKSKGFRMLRFDATDSSAQLEDLKKRYQIVGLPTIIFIDGQGNWRQDLTVTEFVPIDVFLKRMHQIRP